jgi:hypothetical protein
VTDADGRFRLSNVPTNVPLRIRNVTTTDPPGFFGASEQILLLPGEDRSDVEVTMRHYDHTSSTDDEAPPAPPRPLAERLERLLPALRSTGMHALVVLEGGSSEQVKSLGNQLIDYGENRDVLKYRTMTLSTAEVERDAEALTARSWPPPTEGQVVLVALDGAGDVLGAETLAANDATLAKASLQLGNDFIAGHAPPTHDAQQLFADAKALAAATDRRILLVLGGPRCGPCFSLAVWMDRQRELLEKDYVIVKVGICDEGADEVMKPYKPDGGVPWFVILNSQGNPLVTSNGPLGNTGFPGEVESRRHFRFMLDQTAQRLTDDERSSLIQSLENDG